MMTPDEARQLRNGVYRLYWTDDDRWSVASVGRDSEGIPWFCPANWINSAVCYEWYRIERVVLIEPSPS
jgi:hypothetical protein